MCVLKVYKGSVWGSEIWFMIIIRMSAMKFVTLAVLMASAQGAPQFLDQFPQFQQFLDLANSNGNTLPQIPTWLQGI